MHDYKVPNDPDANEWNNLCLEDIGIFWDLPNFDECKHYYFQACNLNGSTNTLKFATPCEAYSPDEVIESHYQWRFNENMNRNLKYCFSSASALSFAVAFLTFL